MSSENQKLISSLCQQLHSRSQALIPGTGVALKEGDQVYIPPGEIHLDRLEQEDVFTFNVEFDSDGNPDLDKDATNPCHNISAYTNLYLKIFQEFDCGCVIYAQPTSSMVISEIFSKHYKIKNNQLISQISNGETKEQYPWTHEIKVPIIENPNDQTKLFSSLEKAFTANPETNAVIVKGNGIIVCGDTWQETKLEFETLLQLFDVSIEMKKLNMIKSDVKNAVTKPTNVAANDDEISVLHEVNKSPKPAFKKAPSKPTTVKKFIKPAKLPTDLRTKIVDDPYKAEALKRKKLALTRLRDRTSGASSIRSREMTTRGRMNAASFMDSMNQSMNRDNGQFSDMNNMMNQQMNMNNMNQQMNNMNQMNMNNMMMGNNAMMMGMNPQPNMNMMMMEQAFMGGGNMNMNNMSMGNMGSEDMSGGGRFRDGRRIAAGRGRPVRGSPAGRGRPSSKGNVKNRLGFKSNITVDHSLLNDGIMNEEDY